MKKYQVVMLIALVWQTCSATVTGLDFVDSVTLDIESAFYGVNWCGDCEYVAAAGTDYSSGTGLGLLQIYQFANNELLFVNSVMLNGGSEFNGVDWCGDDCEYMAAAGTDYSSGTGLGLLQVYQFATNELSLVDSVTLADRSYFYEVNWCGNNCGYVAVAGIAGDLVKNPFGLLQIYEFVNNKLSFKESVTLNVNSVFNGVNWCGDNCEYVAVVGRDNSSGTGLGLLQIYEFANNKLSFKDSVTLDVYSEFYGVNWCGDNCEYVAAAGWAYDSLSGAYLAVLQIYEFINNKLSLKESTTLDVGSWFNGVNWCGDCGYVAVAGVDYPSNTSLGLLQVYKTFQDTAISAPTVHAQKRYNRFPTQVDIINTLWWQAVTDAVSYNVYADSDLSQLLAHVTHAPYIYSQHQIQPGSQKTYYVTAVDSVGNESEAAEITI